MYRASEEPSKKPASYRYRRVQNPFRPGFEQTTKRLASVCSDPPAKGERKKTPDNHVMQKGVNQKNEGTARKKEKKHQFFSRSVSCRLFIMDVEK